MATKKEYYIEYKRMLKGFRFLLIPVYDFYFCIVEIEHKIFYTKVNNLDLAQGLIEEPYVRDVKKIIAKFETENEAVYNLDLFNKYNE